LSGTPFATKDIGSKIDFKNPLKQPLFAAQMPDLCIKYKGGTSPEQDHDRGYNDTYQAYRGNA
jgi:hypothetical protein